MSRFIKPQLATLRSKAPKGSLWLHEIKYDGCRVQIHLNRGRKKVFTRNGLDWTKRFTEIPGALAIPGKAIIDGEVVVVHEGRRAALSSGKIATPNLRMIVTFGACPKDRPMRPHITLSLP